MGGALSGNSAGGEGSQLVDIAFSFIRADSFLTLLLGDVFGAEDLPWVQVTCCLFMGDLDTS
jgi:hypothetical protein